MNTYQVNDSLLAGFGVTEPMTSAKYFAQYHSAKSFAQSSAEILADGYENIFAHPSNSLMLPFILTLGTGNTGMFPAVKVTASNKSMGYPITLGWLFRYMDQEPHLFKRFGLSAENIGMQTGDYLYRRISSMQNPMPENRTLGVTLSYSQITLSVNDICSQTLSGSNTDSQTLRVSFSDAQTLRLTVSQSQKEKDSTANATLWDHAYLRHEINQLVKFWSYCSDDALALRFSDLSFRSHASITHAEKLALGLESLFTSTLSFISSINSCGKRIPLYPDLLFLCPVAICLISKKCFNTYKDTPSNKFSKVFKQNPLDVFKHYDVMYLNTFTDVMVKITTPRSAANTIEASNHNVKEAYAMDTPQHNQTRLKFTFLIASGTQRLVDIHPVRLITVLADSEGEARLLAGMSSLIFVSRQGVFA
ncbi:hypothetical protein [Xenorhabdus bakwenae]|uniref:hypothetical protein n=1 Tax=Xenorhabdus bakwenae TaxID=3026967 RepID=UPI003DA0F5B3